MFPNSAFAPFGTAKRWDLKSVDDDRSMSVMSETTTTDINDTSQSGGAFDNAADQFSSIRSERPFLRRISSNKQQFNLSSIDELLPSLTLKLNKLKDSRMGSSGMGESSTEEVRPFTLTEILTSGVKNDFKDRASAGAQMFSCALTKSGSKEHDKLMIEIKAEIAASEEAKRKLLESANNNEDTDNDDVELACVGGKLTTAERVSSAMSRHSSSFRPDSSSSKRDPGASNVTNKCVSISPPPSRHSGRRSSEVPSSASNCKARSSIVPTPTPIKIPSTPPAAKQQQKSSSVALSHQSKKKEPPQPSPKFTEKDAAMFDTPETKQMAAQRRDLYERYGFNKDWRVNSEGPQLNPMEPAIGLAKESTVAMLVDLIYNETDRKSRRRSRTATRTPVPCVAADSPLADRLLKRINSRPGSPIAVMRAKTTTPLPFLSNLPENFNKIFPGATYGVYYKSGHS